MRRWSRRGALGLALGSAALALGLRSERRRTSTVGLRQSGATPVGTPPDVMLVLGDSIAAGIGASDPTRRGFAAVFHGFLERHLGRSVELVNLARPGETTTAFIEHGQLDEARLLLEDARASGLTIGPILISLGANDLIQAGDDRDALDAALATASANLGRIFSTLRDPLAGGDSSDLLALTYYDPSGSNPDRQGARAWWVARLNAAIVQTAQTSGGRAPDLAPLFRGREDELTWFPTDGHPTNAGHAVIARALWSATGYDTIPPAVTLIRPTPGPLPRPLPTIVARAADTVGVERVVAVVDGSEIGELAYHEVAQAYLLLWDARGLSPSDHQLEVRAIDAAGNVGVVTAIVQPALAASGVPVTATPGTRAAGAAD